MKSFSTEQSGGDDCDQNRCKEQTWWYGRTHGRKDDDDDDEEEEREDYWRSNMDNGDHLYLEAVGEERGGGEDTKMAYEKGNGSNWK